MRRFKILSEELEHLKSAVDELLPSLLGIIRKADEVKVRATDHACVRERFEIDDPCPERLVEEHDRNGHGFLRLGQGQHLEQLIHGAESTGEDDERAGAHRKVHLAHGEIVEAEAEIRRDVGIGPLLFRD